MVSSYTDVHAIWESLSAVDCFSAGTEENLAHIVPVVLTLVHEGRLSLDDVVLRMSENPKRILGLSGQADTFVEVRIQTFSISSELSMTMYSSLY